MLVNDAIAHLLVAQPKPGTFGLESVLNLQKRVRRGTDTSPPDVNSATLWG